MFDISWGEMLLVGGVALIVIGPKDLPHMLRSLGQFTAKLKRMAGEFQGQFHDALRDADVEGTRKALQNPLDNLKSTVRELANNNPLKNMSDSVNSAFQEPNVSLNPYETYDPYAGLTPPHSFTADEFSHRDFSQIKTSSPQNVPRGQLAHLERLENADKQMRLKSLLKPKPKVLSAARPRPAKHTHAHFKSKQGNRT